jgi:lipopolysaccharide transport system ATP-binding protein
LSADVVIRAEGLGKKYLIGHQTSTAGYVALRDEITRAAKGFARSVHDLLRGRPLIPGDEVEEFWALKDVNFEIKRGDVVGIIGRNGAGKSTLLKILSRITEPSAGRVEIKGRVASLLEVGTGFHPELTGRENIFLNGAILGMSRAEIKGKFDEIVDFAGTAKFLDTPVKHYSSGMYVRLAFAVAAHLEPDILVVDEVLAVGDATFQRKCLGTLENIASCGRTVLFVSHNMTAVDTLCSTAFLLQDGSMSHIGSTREVIDIYNRIYYCAPNLLDLSRVKRVGIGEVRFKSVKLVNDIHREVDHFTVGQYCRIELQLEGHRLRPGNARFGIELDDFMGRPLLLMANEASMVEPIILTAKDIVNCEINKFPLSDGRYNLSLFLEIDGTVQDWIREGLIVDVADGSYYGTARNKPGSWDGSIVLVDHFWSISATQSV